MSRTDEPYIPPLDTRNPPLPSVEINDVNFFGFGPGWRAMTAKEMGLSLSPTHGWVESDKHSHRSDAMSLSPTKDCRYVLEVINGCCFEHDTDDIDILGRFRTKEAVMDYAKSIEKMTIKETAQFNLHYRYITSLRVIDISSYPPHVCYEATISDAIGDLKEHDVPRWEVVKVMAERV